ncbi:hypothetical protein Tcan_08307 [Toxocara canis]|uniref:Uncharacterized protein n=1 Tax=Toxocara canis TaxID=6265 RepID=A0A0B2UWY2_TOXCA|nr:hypothetical protein Tcan_08307 [Toxocara canis]
MLPISSSSPLLGALMSRQELCNDHHSAGFLLSNKSDQEWSVACMWTGGETSASCALAPIGNKPINFLEGHKWRKILYAFRTSIGCSKEEIQAVSADMNKGSTEEEGMGEGRGWRRWTNGRA